MSAEDELPLPGEPNFKYRDHPVSLGVLRDGLRSDARTVRDAADPARKSAGAIEASNTGRTAETSTRVANYVAGRIEHAADRLGWFERPIGDYLDVLAAVKTPITTLREKWRQAEGDLKRLQREQSDYADDFAEKWAARQKEIKGAYDKIITETVDPAKDRLIAAFIAISEDREPAPTTPIPLPQLPELPTLPTVPPGYGPPLRDRPRDESTRPAPLAPGRDDKDDENDTRPDPATDDPTPPEILTEWFADHPTDGAAIAAAWLLVPAGAATYDRWVESPAARTSLATWIVRPRQQAAYDAFLAAPATQEQLAAWIAEHGLAEGEAPPADPVAWINDPDHAAARRQWLADPATREVLAGWVSDPANAEHRTAWLSDPKTQNSLVGWLRDPAQPDNGKDFAEWTKDPTPITPLPPPPPEPPTTGEDGSTPAAGDDAPPAPGEDATTPTTPTDRTTGTPTEEPDPAETEPTTAVPA